MKLSMFELAHPITRIPGGGIVVSVSCYFIVPHSFYRDTIRVSGVAVVDKEADIVEGIKTAIKNAEENVSLCETGTSVFTILAEDEDEAIKALIAPIIEEKKEKLSQSISGSELQEALAVLSTEDDQKRMDALCETLGIDLQGRIDIQSWTRLEVKALETALEKKVRKLE